MIYLSGTIHAGIGDLKRPDLGVLMLERRGEKPEWLDQVPWGADNGMFTQPDAFTMDGYLAWLATMNPWRHTCLFATAPDVLYDAIATWALAEPTFPLIRSAGYKAALVAQDGFEDLMPELNWAAFDVLFLGGSTEWKLSQYARIATEEANARGKHVHMGRVNSYSRLQRAKDWGCKSADGNFLKFAPDQNFPRLIDWLDSLYDNYGFF